MKTTTLLLVALCVGHFAMAQSDTVPNLPAGAKLRFVSLQQSIHRHYQEQLAAELAEFTETRTRAAG